MPRIAVTGSSGRLGKVLASQVQCYPLICDVTSKKSIREALQIVKPDVIIHTAAVTDVDACEDELSHRAFLVNCGGTANLREEFSGRIIYISTDYVFDGKDGPYIERDETNPINQYGVSKQHGENVILEFDYPSDIIIRTTILYGGHKPDFVTKIINSLGGNKTVEVPKNLFGSPTSVYHLAEALICIAQSEIKYPRILNIAGKDILSRYEFALMIATVFGYNKDLIIPTENIKSIAKRPKKAGLKLVLAKRLKVPLYTALEGLEDLCLRKPQLKFL